MSLRGDLRTMALPDILQWIAAGRKTGTLHVERRSLRKRIIVRDGNIFSSWSNDPRESLGQFLIRLRLVTEEQLFRALLDQEEKGRLLGSILLADGILSEDDLKRALKAKAEETLFDLFLWGSGEFEFREGDFPEELLITFETPVTPVILERRGQGVPPKRAWGSAAPSSRPPRYSSTSTVGGWWRWTGSGGREAPTPWG